MRAAPATRPGRAGWMKSYKPEELFDADGRLIPDLAEPATP